MTRRDTHLDGMLRNLGAAYYRTTQGTARAADVTRALESVAEEDPRINGGEPDSGELIDIVSRRDLLSVFLLSDEEIAAELRDAISTILLDEGEDITVTVRDGVVTLSGTLARKEMIPVAVRVASDADGVVAVRDKLNSGVPAASA